MGSSHQVGLAGAPPFKVGDWLVRPELNRLESAGDSVRVEPRVMQVLVLLAGNPGEVVIREAILNAVWEGVVVQEEALTHAISRLRRVFGDDPKAARFIETIPKRKYR
ncbi:MAG: winged helix-turn-helix domain-containing protein [Planctomycetota bacterium]